MEVEACGGQRPQLPSSHRFCPEGLQVPRFNHIFVGSMKGLCREAPIS